MTSRSLLFTLLFCGLAAVTPRPAVAEIAVKTGEKIAFLGDSITSQGASSPSGYVQLVISGLAANGIKAEAIGAGVSGNTSQDMLKRLQGSVLSKKPDWMTLSCGVNDVWHGATGVELEPYKKNITDIVSQAQAAGIKVLILTSTMIHENQDEPNNQKLVAYNDFLRQLAKEKNCGFADLNADMQAALKEAVQTKPRPAGGNYLTADGVHMNPYGNQMMAVGVLKGFGLDAAQVGKAREAWQDIPGAYSVKGDARITLRQYEQLNSLAAKRKTSVDSMLNAEVAKAVESLVKQAQ